MRELDLHVLSTAFAKGGIEFSKCKESESPDEAAGPRYVINRDREMRWNV